MLGLFGWRDNSSRVLALLGSLSAAAIVFGAAATASPGSAQHLTQTKSEKGFRPWGI